MQTFPTCVQLSNPHVCTSLSLPPPPTLPRASHVSPALTVSPPEFISAGFPRRGSGAEDDVKTGGHHGQHLPPLDENSGQTEEQL